MSNTALEALDRLVFNGNSPIVVALTGGWGEGKTFFWQQSVVRNRPAPAYVSVFGAESLLAIRERVGLACLETRGAEVLHPEGIRGWLARHRDRLSGTVIGGSRHILGVLNRKWGLPESLAVELLHSLLKPGTTLCIDDVERLSKKVDKEDLLGYICELRDKWKLKIVLIFNREPLEGEKGGPYVRYQEKVVDREIPFSLKPDEIVQLVFDQPVPGFPDLLTYVQQQSEILELRNIRILVKAKSYFQEVSEILGNPPDQAFLKRVIHSVLLFTWMRFSSRKVERLDFDRLSRYSSVLEDFKAADKATKDRNAASEKDPGKDLLDKYGYNTTDDLDLALLKFVTSDVPDVDEIRKVHSAHTTNLDHQARKDAFSDAISKYYHGTLRDNPDELCAAMEMALTGFLPDIDPANLGFVLEVFRVCSKEDIAERFFTTFKETRGATFANIDAHSITIDFSSSTYPPLRKYFQDLINARRTDTRTIEQVLKNVSEVGGAGSDDNARLMSFSQQELKECLQTHDMPRLTSLLRTLVRSGDDNLRTRVFSIAEELAQTSAINRMRLHGMGLLQTSNEPDQPAGPGAT